MDIEFDFEKRYRLVREVIETVVLTVLMFLVIRLAVQNFNIDGMSMEPNFHNQELILVDKWSYMLRTPERGDVIVFVAPPQPSQDYIKRVIGLPGDVITIQNTTVIVNGKTLKDSFVQPAREGNPFRSFINRVIPPNTYFVLGDNRAGSSDSRDWGCVPQRYIIGRAALIYWPLGQDNNGIPPSVASDFNNIPVPPTTNSTDVCSVINNPPATAASSGTALPGNSSSGLSMWVALVLPGIYVGFSRRRPALRANA